MERWKGVAASVLTSLVTVARVGTAAGRWVIPCVRGSHKQIPMTYTQNNLMLSENKFNYEEERRYILEKFEKEWA